MHQLHEAERRKGYVHWDEVDEGERIGMKQNMKERTYEVEDSIPSTKKEREGRRRRKIGMSLLERAIEASTPQTHQRIGP